MYIYIPVVLLAWIFLTLSIRLYHSSLLAGLLDNILSPYRTVVDEFLLIGQHLHVPVKGYLGERHLWVRLCFFFSVPHVLLVLFEWF